MIKTSCLREVYQENGKLFDSLQIYRTIHFNGGLTLWSWLRSLSKACSSRIGDLVEDYETSTCLREVYQENGKLFDSLEKIMNDFTVLRWLTFYCWLRSLSKDCCTNWRSGWVTTSCWGNPDLGRSSSEGKLVVANRTASSTVNQFA